MQIETLLKIIEQQLPQSTAMKGDRLGLQVQSGRKNIKNILITIEITDEVIDEAIENDCDSIITFHPLIFNALTSITDDERVGSLCTKLIKNSISVISIHTNFDAFSYGTSKILADRLDFNVIDKLVPDKDIEGFGMGVIAEPLNNIAPAELLERIAVICNSPLRYCDGMNKKINKIAIVGGSGSSFFENALICQADAFITADLSYHIFHRARGKIMLIDPGHYEMEQFVPIGLYNLLIEKLPLNEIKFIMVSSNLTNPVNYYPNSEIYKNAQKNYLINNKLTHGGT